MSRVSLQIRYRARPLNGGARVRVDVDMRILPSTVWAKTGELSFSAEAWAVVRPALIVMPGTHSVETHLGPSEESSVEDLRRAADLVADPRTAAHLRQRADELEAHVPTEESS